MAISDNATSVIGLPLIARLATNAGDNVRVAFSVTDEERIATHMEEAEIDLVIDADRVVPQGLSSQPLIEEPFVMAQRKAHPRGTDTLDLNAYCALRHVVVTPASPDSAVSSPEVCSTPALMRLGFCSQGQASNKPKQSRSLAPSCSDGRSLDRSSPSLGL